MRRIGNKAWTLKDQSGQWSQDGTIMRAVQKIREIRRETGQEVDPAILPSLQSSTASRTIVPENRYVDGRSQNWLDLVVPARIIIFFGLPQTGKSIDREWVQFSRFSFESNSDSLVSDGACKRYTAPRAFNTRKDCLACGSSGAHASQLASFWFLSQNSHLHTHRPRFTRNHLSLITLLFHFRTAHLPFVFPRTETSTAIHAQVDSLPASPNKVPSHRIPSWCHSICHLRVLVRLNFRNYLCAIFRPHPLGLDDSSTTM